MSDELIVVHTATTQVEADLVKSMLEASGISVMMTQEGAGQAYGLTLNLMGGGATILVAAQDAELALQLLAENGLGQTEEESDEDELDDSEETSDEDAG